MDICPNPEVAALTPACEEPAGDEKASPPPKPASPNASPPKPRDAATGREKAASPSRSFHRISIYLSRMCSLSLPASWPLGRGSLVGHLARYTPLCAVLPPAATSSKSSLVNLLMEMPLILNCRSRSTPAHLVHTKVRCDRLMYPGMRSGHSAHVLLPSSLLSFLSSAMIFSSADTLGGMLTRRTGRKASCTKFANADMRH